MFNFLYFFTLRYYLSLIERLLPAFNHISMNWASNIICTQKVNPYIHFVPGTDWRDHLDQSNLYWQYRVPSWKLLQLNDHIQNTLINIYPITTLFWLLMLKLNVFDVTAAPAGRLGNGVESIARRFIQELRQSGCWVATNICFNFSSTK